MNITAVTDKFMKGMNQASRMAQGFVGRISGMQTALAGLAVAGFGAVVNSVIDTAGKIHELTTKLNIGAEALSALHFAADQLDSSAGALDSGLAKLSVNIGKAVAGSKEASAGFSALHLSAEQLIRAPLEQQFLQVVDALNQIPAGAERAAAAQAIFGKGAKELNGIINAGTQAIIEQGQAAAQTGAVMSSEMVNSLDEAGDSLTRFTAAWAGLKTQLVGSIAPAITFVMDLMTSGLKALRGAWLVVRYAFTEFYVVVYSGMQQIAKLISNVLPSFANIAKDAEFLKNVSIQQRDELGARLDNLNRGGGNPLAPKSSPKNNAVEKNTEKTNTKLDEQTNVLKQIAQQRQPKLALAGVR